jgi:hypothetical protein
MSYQSAISQMNGRTQKKLDNNTYGRLNPDHPEVMIVKLHNTDILTITPEHIVITVDGWQTPTTKDRVNKFMPAGYHIVQKNGAWMLYNYTTQEEFAYVEGMRITRDGKHDCQPFDDKKTKALKRKINAYAKGFITALYAGEVEKPGAGDCLYCQMHTDDGQSLGDATKDKEHLLSHIEEKYYVPSLLYNARKNCDNISPFASNALSIWLSGTFTPANVRVFGVVSDQLTRMLNKYLTERIMA